MVTILKLFCSIVCFAVFLAVNGCGQIPAGGERTINFNVSGFQIPPVMAYTENVAARSKFSAISSSKSQAETFVKRLIMESVEDVLYEQGRSAFLLDSVISSILQQLNVQIIYEPLSCQNIIGPMGAANVGMMMNCIIDDGIVTGICMGTMNGDCRDMAEVLKHFARPNSKYYSISGSIKTSNVIMANWSNQMWQTVLNRVLRRITSSPNGSHFNGASVNLI